MLTVKQNFPLETLQSGAMLGNGWTGATLWGAGSRLNVSLGCADLWDHRGGLPWSEKLNFKAIREALETGDGEKISSLFAASPSGKAVRPSLVPAGRVVIDLPDPAFLLRYEQELSIGTTRVIFLLDGKEHSLEFFADMGMKDALACSGLPEGTKLKLFSSWQLCKMDLPPSMKLKRNNGELDSRGFQASEEFTFENGEGFIQEMPNDPSFSMLYKRNASSFTLGFRRGITSPAMEAEKLQTFEEIATISRKWWEEYWQDVPKITSMDPLMEELYWHGLYKYGIMTNPAGVTPGLQGPWIEDCKLPPWCGDYHFNINIQMCHMPGYNAGKFASLRMLFEKVLSWKEILRHNARCFAGIENGYMLPHAVDDRAVCMGNFWSGNIDHACSAWIAIMMFDYCDYSGDMDFLRNEVYDFMQGVMNIYEIMLEEREDGTLFLPISVSPEFGDNKVDSAWGRNASFQLAAIHRLAGNLLKAAELLGFKPEESWKKIREKLPKATIINGEIAIWEGKLLDESHRHHSHLAGLVPFDVIDPQEEEWEKIVKASMERLTLMGMGAWTGWCMPWASQLHIRAGQGEMAALILKLWKEVFTNAGGASMHDGVFWGFTIFSVGRGEVMQMDGAMGVVTAIQDQYLHSQNGILRAFRGVPARARNISFERMFAPGGFRISGKIGKDGTISLTAEASRDGRLRIQTRSSKVFEKDMKEGESLSLIQKGEELLPC